MYIVGEVQYFCVQSRERFNNSSTAGQWVMPVATKGLIFCMSFQTNTEIEGKNIGRVACGEGGCDTSLTKIDIDESAQKLISMVFMRDDVHLCNVPKR
jgi:hypothetical protein